MKTKLKLLFTETLVAILILVGTVNASELTKQSSLETNLQLEEWMMDETIWNSLSMNMAVYAEDMEESLLVEAWMTTSDVWNTNFAIEMESSLELEEWMTDENVWENQNAVAEASLIVEDWMISDELWQ